MLITVFVSSDLTALTYSIDFSVTRAISGVNMTVCLDDFWIFDKIESKLAKNASFCSVACCHSTSTDRSVDKSNDKETATLARSDSASIVTILDLKPAKTWSKTVLALFPNIASLKYLIASPRRTILKFVNGIFVPQVLKTLMLCNSKHSSHPIGWSLRKRSIATEYFDTQGKSNQKDRRSISVDCCRVPVQMLKDDLEPKSFGSNGSFWFFNCWSLVALSKSRSKVLLLQFLQLKPPPGKSTQFSEGGEDGVIFVVVYSISRKACWQSMAPGTCFELVGTNNLPCSSLAMPGHTPALTFFFQLKMCCEEKQTSWCWRSLTEEITSEDEKVTWLVKIWFVRL